MDPDTITKQLSLAPSRCWQAGKERYDLKGNKLSGTWPETKWWHAWKVNGNLGISFFEKTTLIIDDLYPNRDFFCKINQDQGKTLLIIDLPGSSNQGSELPFSSIKKLAEMKINMGIEVFPMWGK